MPNNSNKKEKKKPEICVNVSWGDLKTVRMEVSPDLKVHQINQRFSEQIGKGEEFYLAFPPDKTLQDLGINDGDDLYFVRKIVNDNEKSKQQNENNINEGSKRDLINWFIRLSPPIQTVVNIIFVGLILIQTIRMGEHSNAIVNIGKVMARVGEAMEGSIKVAQRMFSELERGWRPLDISIVDDKIKILNIGDSLISIKHVDMKTKDNLRIPLEFEDNSSQEVSPGESVKICPIFGEISKFPFPSDRPLKEVIMSVKFVYKGQPTRQQKWKYILVKPEGKDKVIPFGMVPIPGEEPDISG